MSKHLKLSIFLIIALLMVSCGGQAPTTQVPSGGGAATTTPEVQAPASGKLIFSTWGDATFYEDCFNRFQKANPDFAKVQFENVQADSDTTLLQRLMTDWAAKSYDTLPDMNEMSTSAISQLANAGLLVDLTEEMMPYKNDISSAVWDGIIINGKVYAVPWMANSSMIWYRQDVFDMAGVDASQIKTWDDYIEAGKKITNFQYPDGKKRYMASVGAADPGTQTLQLMLGQQDSYLFDPNTGETTIDTDPRFKKAFEMNARLVTEGISLRIDEWEAPWFAALGDGTIASYISANWMDQVIKGGDLGGDQEGKWRAMALPAFEAGGSRGTLESGSANVVIINKPDAKTDIPWKMAQYCYLNKDVTADLLKAHDLVPAYLPALDNPLFTSPDQFYGGQEVGKLDKQIQSSAKPFHYTPKYNEAMSYITEQLQLAMNGSKSIDQAIKDAADSIRINIGKAN
jgi:lactose/L-arabinose transport system substrate-binding protein